MQPPDQPAPGEPNPVSPYAPPADPTPTPPPPVNPIPEIPSSASATPPPYPGALPPTGIGLSSEEKNWAMGVHLAGLCWLISLPGIVGCLVVWLVQRDKMPFVDVHGKEAVNFQLTLLFVELALVVIGFITCGIGFFLMPIPAIFGIVMCIIAGIKAANGEYYQYPLTWRLIK